MTSLTLHNISETMRDIDVCMLTTKTAAGTLESRPMSNNRDVDYQGDSYFFSSDDCSAVQDIAADSSVNLSFIHRSVLSKDIYISINGTADLIRDREILKQHWTKDVDLWFENGIDTPGIVLIHVKAHRIKHWSGMEEKELLIA